jgi:diacylglycerol kinase family enzyme
MMSRPDWKDLADSLTFGFIPAGGGNGLVKSIAAVSDPCSFSIEEAAFTIVKGRRMKLDLTELELEYQPDQKVYMFLSLSWGYITDCDIESEVIRWAGLVRSEIWGAYRIVSRKY